MGGNEPSLGEKKNRSFGESAEERGKWSPATGHVRSLWRSQPHHFQWNLEYGAANGDKQVGCFGLDLCFGDIRRKVKSKAVNE